jgi:hypothetical protein
MQDIFMLFDLYQSISISFTYDFILKKFLRDCRQFGVNVKKSVNG